MVKIIYRLSESGYNKVKPNYINNINCLKNALQEFNEDTNEWLIIADNIGEKTEQLIREVYKGDLKKVSIGNGAGTFNLAMDEALECKQNFVYFLENDYLHRKNSNKVLIEGLKLGADFISLYDHPDKYIDGVNPYIDGGGEITKVFLSDSCHWKLTNSTTMTFATSINQLKESENVLRKWTSTTHPHDFEMWIELRELNKTLITPIPGYSTHGESQWLSPLMDWSTVV